MKHFGVKMQERHPSLQAAWLFQTIFSNEAGSDSIKACYRPLVQHLAPLMMIKLAILIPPALGKKYPPGKQLHSNFFSSHPTANSSVMQAAQA